MVIYYTVVGRERKDFEKIGIECAGYIGKHIVGTGEDAHLTTKVFIDFFKIHVILICGKRGSGKCLTGDTLVYLSDGSLKKIEEIVKERNQYTLPAFNFKNLKMENSKIVNFFEREVDKIFEITLWNGLKIKVSDNHPFLTINGWKEAKDLKEGEFIAIINKVNVEGKEVLRDYEVKLLAYLLSERAFNIRKDFIKCLKEFDENLTVKNLDKYTIIISKEMKRNDYTFTKDVSTEVERNFLFQFLKKFNLTHDKSIPEIIFKSSNKQVAIFLRALFSCDGSLYVKKVKGKKRPIIEYASRSREMVESIYFLLLRFGILSHIREKRIKGNLYYRLFIKDEENITKFLERIGFIGKGKEVKEVKNLLKDNRKHSNYNLIPKIVWKYLIEKYGMNLIPKYDSLQSKIKEVADKFNDEFLRLVSSDEITWVKIKNIKEIKEKTKVYDIEVNAHHNFIANGILVHNSYSAGTILEEFSFLPENYRNKMCFIVVDPVGIYWSMKYPNEQQKNLLKEWNLEPRALENIEVLVPEGQLEEYKRAGIPVDDTITLSLKDLTSEELLLAFGLKRISREGVALEKNFNKLLSYGGDFDLNDLIEEIRKDEEIEKDVKISLINLLSVANSWRLISKKGKSVKDMVKPGKIIIIDLSRMRSDELRALIVSLLAREIYRLRVLARKEEERAKITRTEPLFKFPITWLVLEECHNFIPSDKEVASSEAIKTIAKQGREPGVGLIVITQMPNKVHQEILSQTDIVISFRLTSRDDLDSLHAVMQTYVREELEKYINSLPRWPGAAIVLDDNLERIFPITIRPRQSWHSGGTAAIG